MAPSKCLKDISLAFMILSIKCLFWSCCDHPGLSLKRKSEGQDFTDCSLHGPLLCVWVFDSKNDGWSLKTV